MPATKRSAQESPAGSKAAQANPVAVLRTGSASSDAPDTDPASLHAAVVINRRYEVLHSSGPTQLYLQQPSAPPIHDLLTLAPAALRPRIRAAVLEALDGEDRVEVGGIRIKRAGQPIMVSLGVQPLPAGLAEEPLLLIVFRDEPKSLKEAMADEAQAKTDAQRVRQLEFELKTTREALKSASEELATVNAQLRDKTDALEEANADLSNLQDSVDNAILILGADRTIKRFTPSATHLFNLTAADIGRSIDPFTRRFDDPDLSNDIDRVLKSLEPSEKQVTLENRQPFLRRITPYRTADNRISGVVLTLTDFTALKQNELDLRNQTAQLEQRLDEHATALRHERNFIDAILNTSAAVIMVLDPEQRLVRFNAACLTISGQDLKKMRGTTAWMDLIPPDEREGVHRSIERMLAGENLVPLENQWIHKDGSLRLIGWSNTVLRDEAGQIQYLIGTGIDITDQRKAENLARETLEQASRLQRLQTANELATVLAHELNQPLAAIATYAEAGLQLLAHTPLAQDKLTRNLEQISQQSLRAGEAIRHIRSFVSRGTIDPTPLELSPLLRNICNLMMPRARARGIDLMLELAEPMPQVMGVGVHIDQVLLNLLRNAIDAIRDTHMNCGSITVVARQENGMAQVSVLDSGTGLDAAMTDKVFDPLSSRKQYGLGVGLRISRNLIEAHGGRLWVEPHMPGGRFHFTLPFVS